jgi:hypothetical protein
LRCNSTDSWEESIVKSKGVAVIANLKEDGDKILAQRTKAEQKVCLERPCLDNLAWTKYRLILHRNYKLRRSGVNFDFSDTSTIKRKLVYILFFYKKYVTLIIINVLISWSKYGSCRLHYFA